jgi:hypothetical protein
MGAACHDLMSFTRGNFANKNEKAARQQGDLLFFKGE